MDNFPAASLEYVALRIYSIQDPGHTLLKSSIVLELMLCFLWGTSISRMCYINGTGGK